MAGILSKGITLGYAVGLTDNYTIIENLQSCPNLGGAAEKVDVTTLADGNYKYINGIKDFGDLEFTFLYDNSGETSNYRIVRGLEDDGAMVNWEVSFPDGTKFHFSGEVATATQGGDVNTALQFVATITLNSDIVVVHPAD